MTTNSRLVRPFFDLTDEELFESIREQVNKSRITGNHERLKTRQLAHEANQRGWNLKTNVLGHPAAGGVSENQQPASSPSDTPHC